MNGRKSGAPPGQENDTEQQDNEISPFPGHRKIGRKEKRQEEQDEYYAGKNHRANLTNALQTKDL